MLNLTNGCFFSLVSRLDHLNAISCVASKGGGGGKCEHFVTVHRGWFFKTHFQSYRSWLHIYIYSINISAMNFFSAGFPYTCHYIPSLFKLENVLKTRL